MYFVFYLQALLVLVSGNSLYEFSCCPNTYSSYGNDQPLLVQRSDYNPYPLSFLVQNSLNRANVHSVPHHYQSLNTNNFVPNYQYYNRNGLEYQHYPELEAEKVINNYILIPQEYFRNNAFENNSGENTKTEINKKNFTKYNRKSKNKRRKPHTSAKINNDKADLRNPDTKTIKPKVFYEESDSNSRPKKNNNNNSNVSKGEEPLPLKKVKNANNHLICSCDKKNIPLSNKPNYQEPKQLRESPKKGEVTDYIHNVKMKSINKNDNGFADVNVGFDINEECTDLDCRHTRNNNGNRKKKIQPPKLQPDLPNNFNSYMNNLPYNQQMTPNFFNANSNFPYNFDYLYQMPQTSNVKPKESNNRRKSRKRKQPTSNRKTNSNKKNEISITTVGSCDKVVELTPETPKIETTTVVALTTTTISDEPVLKNVIHEELATEKDQDSILEKPIGTYKETLFTESLSGEEISNNNNVPVDNSNKVTDEYYPDFTLDNTYMSSKEDYDFGHFHDRYYYAYGDKPEPLRDRQKNEHTNDNELKYHRKIKENNQNKNTLQESSQIQEIIYKTDTSKEKLKVLNPSVLEFPGFKTEMIDKEKYFAEDRSNNYDKNSISTIKMCPSLKHAEGKENRHNNVEMVFANSKVVKYGAPEKEVSSKVPESGVKRELKKLYPNDGKTTVVIAESLGYSY